MSSAFSHEDLHNTELQWRIARVLVEKADLSKDHQKQIHLLHQVFLSFRLNSVFINSSVSLFLTDYAKKSVIVWLRL